MFLHIRYWRLPLLPKDEEKNGSEAPNYWKISQSLQISDIGLKIIFFTLFKKGYLRMENNIQAKQILRIQ